MMVAFLLRTAVVTVPWLIKMAAAAADASAMQQPLAATPLLGSVGGTTMGDCNPSISVCGKTADVKVITAHRSTIYSTRNHTFETVMTLSPEYVTVTEIKLQTVITETEGQCRQTTTIYNEAPHVITVDVNITTTREFVPISTTTTVSISTIKAKAIEQCIVKTLSFHEASSSQFVASTSSSQAPPPEDSFSWENDPSLDASTEEAPTPQSTPTDSSFAEFPDFEDEEDVD